jgi:hypothetical protein
LILENNMRVNVSTYGACGTKPRNMVERKKPWFTNGWMVVTIKLLLERTITHIISVLDVRITCWNRKLVDIYRKDETHQRNHCPFGIIKIIKRALQKRLVQLTNKKKTAEI